MDFGPLFVLRREVRFELLQAIDSSRVAASRRLQRAVEQRVLNLVERLGDVRDELGRAATRTLPAESRRPTNDLAAGDVARADLDPHRHAALHPLPFLSPPRMSRSSIRTRIGSPSYVWAASSCFSVSQYGSTVGSLVVVAIDRQDHDVRRRQLRRQHQAVVVAVRHDQPADEPRRDAPGRRPGDTSCAILVLRI